MNNKIDVFEILNANIEKDQEQNIAPDFNFFNIRELLEKEPAVPAPNSAPAPAPKPEPKPVPKPVSVTTQKAVMEEPEPVKLPDFTAMGPEPEPVSLQDYAAMGPEPEPEPEPVGVPGFVMVPPEPEPVIIPEPKKKKTFPKIRKTAEKRNRRPVAAIIKLSLLAALIVLLMTFVIGFIKVSVNSMYPVIGSGDYVIVNKATDKLKKGSVVVFKDENGDKQVARIIAVQGDMVRIDHTGGLYVNNELQNEEYIQTETIITDDTVSYPVIVDEGTYFVLGDNRTDAADSRDGSIGLLEKNDIVGKVVFCFKHIK